MEALQFLKYCHELLFWEEPSTVLEVEEYNNLQGAGDRLTVFMMQNRWAGMD